MDYPEDDYRADRYGPDRPDARELAEYARELRQARAQRVSDDPWQTTQRAR